LKILFVIPEYYPHSGGGISTYYINYINALKRHCEKIKVIVGSGYFSRDDNFNLDGVEVEYLKPAIYQSYISKFTRFNVIPELKQNLAAAWAMYEQANHGEGFDAVECTEFGLGFIPWIINHNKPVVTRLHGSSGQIAFYETNKTTSLLTDFVRQAELLLLPCCDKLVTYSGANQVFWNERLRDAEVTMISPVFGTSLTSPLPLAERANFGLVTARIQQWKGPVELCGSLVKLPSAERPVVKWFGRDMPYSDTESTVQLLERRFPGVWGVNVLPQKPIENSEVIKLQQQAKFGLVPSTWDMFNFTLTEFLAAGTPVICADGAGASGLIEHGVNGFKYPANDDNALADCIRQITGMKEDAYMQMAMAGLETVRQGLSDDKIIPKNIAQYDALIRDFKPQIVDEYIGGIFNPDEKNHTLESVLDKQPLKLLLPYALKRLKSKLWKP
jgi:glycosyltransferase involved in cell wall biosynthesis